MTPSHLYRYSKLSRKAESLLYPLFKRAQFASIPPVRGTILTILAKLLKVRSAATTKKPRTYKGARNASK